METAQFCEAYDLARGMGFHLARGVGGRLFTIRRVGAFAECQRTETIKAALAWCKANGKDSHK